MARGFLCEVARDKQDIGCYDANEVANICSDFGHYWFDHCTDVDRESKTYDRVEGALIDKFIEWCCPFGKEDGILSFKMTDSVKNSYFDKKLRAFQKLAGDLTVSQFADTYYVWELNNAIDNNYEDMVCWEGELMTVDSFMRRAKPGMKFYIGNIILVH